MHTKLVIYFLGFCIENADDTPHWDYDDRMSQLLRFISLKAFNVTMGGVRFNSMLSLRLLAIRVEFSIFKRFSFEPNW